MKRILSIVSAAAIAISSIASSLAPANAVTLAPAKIAAPSDVTEAQVRRHYNRRPAYHHRPGWYRGHRGYRYHRPGYRRHSDGWWYPLAAFGAGAIIGGIIANQGRGYSNAHIEWCHSRYRSYRASDNTFQPYNGPRRQCVSPYR